MAGPASGKLFLYCNVMFFVSAAGRENLWWLQEGERENAKMKGLEYRAIEITGYLVSV